MKSIEQLPIEDAGLSKEEFDSLEAKRSEKDARREALVTWSSPEDAYFEFPGSFSGGHEQLREQAMREMGLTGKKIADAEHLSPQGAVLHYLDNPNNRESSVFRYLVDWGIDPNRNGEGVRLSFQHPLSDAEKKEIERIFKIFGWGGEEYEVKKEPAAE